MGVGLIYGRDKTGRQKMEKTEEKKTKMEKHSLGPDRAYHPWDRGVKAAGRCGAAVTRKTKNKTLFEIEIFGVVPRAIRLISPILARTAPCQAAGTRKISLSFGQTAEIARWTGISVVTEARLWRTCFSRNSFPKKNGKKPKKPHLGDFAEQHGIGRTVLLACEVRHFSSVEGRVAF